MTAFCGYFDRRENYSAHQRIDKLNEIQSRAVNCLSRNPHHKIHEYVDKDMFFIAFDNGAWQNTNHIRNTNASAGWVSGNPVITGPDGISNSPDDSARRVAHALESEHFEHLSVCSGSFSALLWSISRSSLLLCSDKLALRPIYVYLDDNCCYFSTTIRVLRSMLADELDLDDTGIAQFVCLAQNIGKKTVFKNVEIVPPSTVLEINRKS